MGQSGQQLDAVSGAITPAALDKLQKAYKRPEMKGILVQTLPKMYLLATEYVQAVGDLLYQDDLPEEGDPGIRSTLSVQDRERCLVAVLACHEGGLPLAIHIHIALMEGVLPQEIAHILLLAGVYGGVDRLTNGLKTALAVLQLLKTTAEGEGPFTATAIVTALSGEFPVAFPPAPASGKSDSSKTG
jgi:alkylhydroperoxidase/carboxymuconolactone decarboxylase family protein YurZ